MIYICSPIFSFSSVRINLKHLDFIREKVGQGLVLFNLLLVLLDGLLLSMQLVLDPAQLRLHDPDLILVPRLCLIFSFLSYNHCVAQYSSLSMSIISSPSFISLLEKCLAVQARKVVLTSCSFPSSAMSDTLLLAIHA